MESIGKPFEHWTILRRIRSLIAIYFIFLMLDFTSNDELFPHFVYVVMKFYTDFWNWIVPWTGAHILHLPAPITIRPGGSGDTTYNYVLQLLWIVFSVAIALVWTLLDRKRPSYFMFNYWSRIIVRYFLAYMLFVYGFVKVIKLQFPFPSLIRLVEPYGESSPMGLAWTFIGYSSGYNIFIGGAEVLAGILLFFKRTTLLGALLAMTVMANVAAMNFAYDIPVKLFSLNLLLMATWIAWADKDRLISLFILHTAIPEKPKLPVPSAKWKRILQLSLKTLAILFALYSTLWNSISSAKIYGDSAEKPPLYGIYDVQTFIRNDQVLPPLATDSSRWKRIIINYQGSIRITNMTDSSQWMKFDINTVSKTAKITPDNNSKQISMLRYKVTNGSDLEMVGSIAQDSVRIVMKKFDVSKFPLVNRGFHWINEYPYNR